MKSNSRSEETHQLMLVSLMSRVYRALDKAYQEEFLRQSDLYDRPHDDRPHEDRLPIGESVRILPDGRVSANDAAVYLGRSAGTLAAWRMKNYGPKPAYVGRKVFYWKSELDDFLREEVTPSPSSNDADEAEWCDKDQ